MIDISINLLPEEAKRTRRILLQNLAIFSICLTISIIFCILLLVLFSLKTTLAISERSALRQIDNLEGQIAGFKDLQEQTIFINDRAAEFQNKDLQKIAFSQILTEISKCTPAALQTTQITFNIKSKPMVKITGKTTSLKEAVRFKEKIEESPLFSEVNFNSSTLDASTGLISFNIDFNLEGVQIKEK